MGSMLMAIATMLAIPFWIRNFRARLFFLGGLCHAGISMSYQDWLGLEGYIMYLQEHWASLSWVTGAAICVYAIVYAVISTSRDRDRLRAAAKSLYMDAADTGIREFLKGNIILRTRDGNSINLKEVKEEINEILKKHGITNL